MRNPFFILFNTDFSARDLHRSELFGSLLFQISIHFFLDFIVLGLFVDYRLKVKNLCGFVQLDLQSRIHTCREEKYQGKLHLHKL